MAEKSGPLSGALRSFLKQRGFARRMEQVAAMEAWPDVVGGAVAAATRPLAISADGTMVVGVKSSAWMNELSMMERELVAALNRSNPAAPIQRIRWQLIP
jgi:predicted nucleic acid-binding Zn ribbon protein